MEKLFEKIASHFDDLNKINTKVSRSSIGWHLYHLMRVITGIEFAMTKSDPKEYKFQFNWSKIYVFMTNGFPRGSARAPKSTVPQEKVTRDQLEELLAHARKAYDNILLLDKNQFFKHPYFGNLNKKSSIRFLKIHTIHHLKIIRDIKK